VFTGIVQEIGTVEAVEHGLDGSALRVAATTATAGLRLGDSVAVDGCCLTATTVGPTGASFAAMHETLTRTTLGDLRAGHRVNLEAALKAGEPLGGHNVQGHVDGVGGIVAERAEGFSRVLEIVPPAHLLRYIVEKGSICVAGASLTVSALTRDGFEVCLIPHTCAATTLGSLVVGSRVNIETDIFAKYVERLVAHAAQTGGAPGTPDTARPDRSVEAHDPA
jgi:riboflavin synthase